MISREEQLRVIRFAFELTLSGKLSGDKLSGLAERLPNIRDP